MKYMIMTFVLITTAAVLVSAQSSGNPDSDNDRDCPRVFAQTDPDTGRQPQNMPPEPPCMHDGHRPGPGCKAFEHLRRNKLVQFLGLEGEDREAFVAASEKYRSDRMELDRSHKATLDSLAMGLRAGDLEEEDIDRFVEKLGDLERRRQASRREFREEIKPLLEPDQYGKLVVFEYRFEAKILNRLNEFRRGGGPPFDEARRHDKRAHDLDDDSI